MRYQPFPPHLPFMVAALLGLSGCGRDPAAAVSAAAAAESAAIVESGKGADYVWSISYPALRPQRQALDQAIHAFAAEQKKLFLDASAAADRVKGVEYSLNLSFAVARRTADFVSIAANGNAFVGGAHANPVLASFNLDLTNHTLIGIGDLFSDPQAALNALSDECRRQLEGRYAAKLHEDSGVTTPAQQAPDIRSIQQWIDQGTQPAARNFQIFLVDGLDTKAIGLTVIFPPYQAESYADGPQQVEVPAQVFYSLLKPEYRGAFAIDTEAQKLDAGVR